MEQWLDHRDRYLHLLLEMEGVTQAPKCSVCSKAMEVKCSDCIGGSYFCRACCIQSHRSSPFHWMSQWTGSHFMPVSLYSLGFVLCLGHQGHPCPMTLEQSMRRHHLLWNFQISLMLTSLLNHFATFLGNPLLTVVHQSGILNMEVLYCICPNAGEKDKQLCQSGMLPSSFKQIETAFTFSALKEFLTDNLECKTTAQEYFSKLQGITNWMFPHTVPNLYRQLLRASHQWRDLRNRMQSSLGHQDEDGIDGSMAIFCPACPQPGINLPDDWKIRYNETFIMDGNFAAEHMQCRFGDKDVPLSPRMAFMANPEAYKTHLKSGWESIQPSTCNTYKAIEQANSSRPHLDVTGIGATACCHGFFVPTSVVDFQKGERQVNMDYSLCKALSYNMEDIPVALVMYDIMCQYGVHLSDRVEKSPELSIANSLELWTGIGLFHIHGHQDSCLPHFSPSYITGAKQVDGEIIETLWPHSTMSLGASEECPLLIAKRCWMLI
ncbi:hypothetical protein EI94DRAFT_1898635 [Lactarius quietus]|nr:hypothetical protein EI94DRAFT_1898635 [Lactarius quietus]